MKPTIDKRLVERHFSRNASQYDDVAPVQRAMGEVLLDNIKTKTPDFAPNSIIELGCGTGNLTVNLSISYVNAEIMAVDISPAMVETAKKRIGVDDRIKFMVADAEEAVVDVLAGSKFDLIITNAAIQWFSQPEVTVRKYLNLLSDNGILAFSTFGPGTFMELRYALEATENALNREHTPHLLRFASADEWKESLPPNSDYDVEIIEKSSELEYSTVTQFLLSIKMSGASTPYAQKSFTMGKQFYQKLQEEYNTRWCLDGSDGVTATYHMIYVVLRRK